MMNSMIFNIPEDVDEASGTNTSYPRGKRIEDMTPLEEIKKHENLDSGRLGVCRQPPCAAIEPRGPFDHRDQPLSECREAPGNRAAGQDSRFRPLRHRSPRRCAVGPRRPDQPGRHPQRIRPRRVGISQGARRACRNCRRGLQKGRHRAHRPAHHAQAAQIVHQRARLLRTPAGEEEPTDARWLLFDRVDGSYELDEEDA